MTSVGRGHRAHHLLWREVLGGQPGPDRAQGLSLQSQLGPDLFKLTFPKAIGHATLIQTEGVRPLALQLLIVLGQDGAGFLLQGKKYRLGPSLAHEKPRSHQ